MNIKFILSGLERRWAKTNPKRYEKFLRRKGVKLGNVWISDFTKSIQIDISRPTLVEIGDNVRINKDFTLLTHDFATMIFRIKYNDFVPSSGKVKIGNNVSFGMDCTVLKGVTIGDNCFIGIGSVVSQDIPANSLAVGRPARVVSSIEDYYKKRKDNCIEEAFVYARSIQERFNRQPVITDFWEEFPLFLNGDEERPELPIKHQLGAAYEHYKKIIRRFLTVLKIF